jgi:hypothetical protein
MVSRAPLCSAPPPTFPTPSLSHTPRIRAPAPHARSYTLAMNLIVTALLAKARPRGLGCRLAGGGEDCSPRLCPAPLPSTALLSSRFRLTASWQHQRPSRRSPERAVRDEGDWAVELGIAHRGSTGPTPCRAHGAAGVASSASVHRAGRAMGVVRRVHGWGRRQGSSLVQTQPAASSPTPRNTTPHARPHIPSHATPLLFMV